MRTGTHFNASFGGPLRLTSEAEVVESLQKLKREFEEAISGFKVTSLDGSEVTSFEGVIKILKGDMDKTNSNCAFYLEGSGKFAGLQIENGIIRWGLSSVVGMLSFYHKLSVPQESNCIHYKDHYFANRSLRRCHHPIFHYEEIGREVEWTSCPFFSSGVKGIDGKPPRFLYNLLLQVFGVDLPSLKVGFHPTMPSFVRGRIEMEAVEAALGGPLGG